MHPFIMIDNKKNTRPSAGTNAMHPRFHPACKTTHPRSNARETPFIKGRYPGAAALRAFSL
jgi:hypothetical protein